MSRLEKNDYFLQIAELVKQRGTCLRRQVGCVLVDQYSHIIATGYNGTAKNMPHCLDEPCSAANAATGQDLEGCEAIHAEQNAMLQCPDVMQVVSAYCTDSPCIHCMKLFMNTSVKTIYYAREY